MRKIVILLGSVAVLVVGCGGGSSTPVKLTGSVANKGTKTLSGNDIEVEQDDYYFNPTFIKGGTPGTTVTVHLKNEGKNQHNFTVESQGIDTSVDPGGTADVRVTLPASGATAFYCKFHHDTNGMQGAFFFKDGDTIAATGGAPASPSTSSSQNNGGYDYN